MIDDKDSRGPGFKDSSEMLTKIAEGYGHKITSDYIKSLYSVYGSKSELETQIMLSGDLDYIDSDIVQVILDEINEA